MAGWAGEPEVDATQDYEDREAVEGWELHPRDCLKWAYQATLRERAVVAGVSLHAIFKALQNPPASCEGSSTACLINLNASSGLLRAAKYGFSNSLFLLPMTTMCHVLLKFG
jgi:protein phosphatase PTC7